MLLNNLEKHFFCQTNNSLSVYIMLPTCSHNHYHTKLNVLKHFLIDKNPPKYLMSSSILSISVPVIVYFTSINQGISDSFNYTRARSTRIFRILGFNSQTDIIGSSVGIPIMKRFGAIDTQREKISYCWSYPCTTGYRRQDKNLHCVK